MKSPARVAGASARRVSALALLMVLAGFVTGGLAQFSPVRPAPPLPAPTGSVVTVSTVSALQSAVATLTSGTTILISPGVYRLTQELRIRNGVTNVALRGTTNNRDDVVILGTGMNTPGINIALKVENAQDVLIANLSIGEAFWHPIQLQGEAGAERVRVYNVRLFDAGQQFLKSTVNPASPNGVDDGVVEYSLLEYTSIGPAHGYTEGIDVHHGARWIIRYNLFRNIHVPATAPDKFRPAILMWSGSRDTLVDSNVFIDCERGIIFGLGPQSPYAHSHSGGTIVNNFIYRTQAVNADAGISVWDSPGTKVLHNTVIQNGTYRNAIEYRFPGTTGVEIVNNLTDGQIQLRDGAQGSVYNNYTAATPAYFVNPAAGDLHLTAAASAALDLGVYLPLVERDWDGEPRISGAAADLGADERAVTAPPPPGGRINVALSSNGATAVASSTHSSGYGTNGAINGDRRGSVWGSGAGWNDATPDAFPDWFEIRFSGVKTIDEIAVFSVQDAYQAPDEPTTTMTFTLYGLRDFEVEYWTGTAWTTVPGGAISGNTLVWRRLAFPSVETDRIRLRVTHALGTWSRIVEVEAWGSGDPPPPPGRINVALSSNGGTAVASSTHSSGYDGSGAINGDRRGHIWGAAAGWNDATPDVFPDWLEIRFDSPKTIDELSVFSVQDNYQSPVEPTPTLTFSLYGLRDFEVQYWTGSAWAPVPGGTVSGNALVWRRLTFAAVTTTGIRVFVTQGLGTYSRIAEVEVYGWN
jgi:hypothetical protein